MQKNLDIYELQDSALSTYLYEEGEKRREGTRKGGSRIIEGE